MVSARLLHREVFVINKCTVGGGAFETECLPIKLSIYSFLSAQAKSFPFYSVGCHLLLSLYILMFGQWEPLEASSCVLAWISPHHSLNTSCFLVQQGTLGSSCTMLSCPRPEISLFFEEARFHFMTVGTQRSRMWARVGLLLGC